MKISLLTLAPALKMASLCASAKSPSSDLGCIRLFKKTNDSVAIFTSDMRTGFLGNLNVTELEADFDVLIPSELFMKIMQANTRYSTVEIKVNGTNAIVSFSGGDSMTRYEIPTVSSLERPETILANVMGEMVTADPVVIHSEALKSMLVSTEWATLRTDASVLSGLFLEAKDSRLTSVGADGKSLSYKSLPIRTARESKVTIPRNACNVLHNILKGIDEEVHLDIQHNRLYMRFGGAFIFTCVAIAGDYIPYNRVIETANGTNIIVVDKEKLEEVIKQLMVMTDSAFNRVEIAPSSATSMNLKVEHPLFGKSEIACPCTFTGDLSTGLICMNIEMLRDAIASLPRFNTATLSYCGKIPVKIITDPECRASVYISPMVPKRV